MRLAESDSEKHCAERKGRTERERLGAWPRQGAPPQAGRTVGWGSGGLRSRLPEQAGRRLLCRVHGACGGSSPRPKAILTTQMSSQLQPQKPSLCTRTSETPQPTWSEAGEGPPRAASGSAPQHHPGSASPRPRLPLCVPHSRQNGRPRLSHC